MESTMNGLDLQSIGKVSKDIRTASAVMGKQEARYLVDMYYQIQDYRKATANQCRAMSDEPHEVLEWFLKNAELMEGQIKTALGRYADHDPVGHWMMGICGIGPVIAAGLLAHIDIEKAPTVGHIWNFAGLNPDQTWNKGEKRPWNADLKVLCWKIGQSFVKVSNNPNDVYGKVYKERKEYETAKNEAGEYAEQAKAKLERFKIGKDTEAYKYYSEGKLPPAHIQQRAERYAVKLFLSHLHEVWYKQHYGTEPPKPFAIAQLGHAHYIAPPNTEATRRD